MSCVSAGSVEQLLELAGKATGLPWRTLPLSPPPTTAIERPYEGGAATPIGKVWSPEDADLIVAAVNLVEPLARDWQRLKHVEEAARHFWNYMDNATYGDDRRLVAQTHSSIFVTYFQALESALAAVSGEPDE